MQTAGRGSHAEREASLLERLMDEFREEGKFTISFDDLTGILHDIDELRLPERLQVHDCAFCMRAKSTISGLSRCVRNKRAVNWLAVRRKRPFTGVCHLGVTDCVHPVAYEGTILGVLYGGGVRHGVPRALDERAVCGHGGEAGVWERERESLMVEATDRDLGRLRGRLEILARFIAETARAAGIQPTDYRTRCGMWTAAEVRRFPPLVQEAIRYVSRHFSRHIDRGVIAAHLRCNPSHLSETFKRSTGISLRDWIHRVRIGQAKRLLTSGRMDVSGVAFACGFEDVSHFIRLFRRETGMTPGEWIRRADDLA